MPMSTSSPVTPRSAKPFHTTSLVPRRSSIIDRTYDIGALSARNRRTVSRSAY